MPVKLIRFPSDLLVLLDMMRGETNLSEFIRHLLKTHPDVIKFKDDLKHES